MAFHRQDDWLPVLGETVEIRQNHKIIRTGTVDAVTPDGTILWLRQQWPQERWMVERALGYQVWIRYNWES